jgi:hypothetical protein
MNETRVVLKPDPAANVERGRDVRAAAWAYIFSCSKRRAKKKKKGGPETAPNARKESDELSRNADST